MPKKDSFDDRFRAIMQAEGVVPLDAQAAHAKERPGSKPGREQVRRQEPEPARGQAHPKDRAAGRAALRGSLKGRQAAVGTSGATLGDARGERATLDAEVSAVRVERDARDAELVAARTERDARDAKINIVHLERDALDEALQAARTERDALEAELTIVRMERDARDAKLNIVRMERDARDAKLNIVRMERDALDEALQAARTERDSFDAERRALAQQLAALREQAPGVDILDVPAALGARGLPDRLHAQALADLLRAQPEATLRALDGTEPDALRRLLDQRLVATCGDGTCDQVDPSIARVAVDPGDCEVCGGRQAGAAFARLTAACARHAVRRIVVVGGSPNSRRALRDLADESSLRINTFDGTSKPAARKVQRIERTTDLIVIWAGTILDHATTAAFHGIDRPTEIIPFRGLERMLDALTERIDRWR